MHDTFSHPPPKNFIRTINYRKKLNAEIFHESQKKKRTHLFSKFVFCYLIFFVNMLKNFPQAETIFVD